MITISLQIPDDLFQRLTDHIVNHPETNFDQYIATGIQQNLEMDEFRDYCQTLYIQSLKNLL